MVCVVFVCLLCFCGFVFCLCLVLILVFVSCFLEQFEPFGAEERLHPHPTRRNNGQFGRRNNTGINRSLAEYWIFKHQILLQWLPYRRYRRLPWQNHCRTPRSKSLTLLVSPLDMMGLMGMAQVIATIAYGIRGLRREETTWR